TVADSAQFKADSAKTAANAPVAPDSSADSSATKAPASAPEFVVKDEAASKPGAILPHKRIVAYYGNPLSKRMGILGEIAPNKMLARLDEEVKAWNAADPGT